MCDSWQGFGESSQGGNVPMAPLRHPACPMEAWKFHDTTLRKPLRTSGAVFPCYSRHLVTCAHRTCHCGHVTHGGGGGGGVWEKLPRVLRANPSPLPGAAQRPHSSFPRPPRSLGWAPSSMPYQHAHCHFVYCKSALLSFSLPLKKHH